jgi:hypothetical protein
MARTGFHDIQFDWTRHQEALLHKHRDILIRPARSDEEVSTQLQQKFFKAFQLRLMRDRFTKTAIKKFFPLWCHSGGKHNTMLDDCRNIPISLIVRQNVQWPDFSNLTASTATIHQTATSEDSKDRWNPLSRAWF